MWSSLPNVAGIRCTGELRQHLGEVLRRLAMLKECRVEGGHLMPDHHMMISIQPKMRCRK